MPLFDSRQGYRKYDPNEFLKWDIMKAAHRVFRPVTLDKMIRTTDLAVSTLQPSERSNLVWTKAGAIFGYHSKEPVASINHVWTMANDRWGTDSKLPLLFVGSLLMWRISLRQEQWLTDASKTGNYDPDTGKEITERSYWINNKIKIEYTVDDLISKFNKK